ncbi:MAG: hypothetical protein P0S96_06510 [Simkaniaceae bacterium]|nr:hypothetical protein [Candidatus Sacchlamyda saccharinae]
MKRKFLIFFLFLLTFCGGAYFFRYDLLILGTKFALGKNISYTEIQAKDEKVQIQGLGFSTDQMQLTVGDASFGFEFLEIFKSPARLISLYRNGLDNWHDLLLPIKQYGLNLNVETGILTLDDQRYFFQFKAGEKKHEIGTLFISHDPRLMDHPFLVMKFHVRGDELISQLAVEEVPASRLIHLASFALPQYFAGYEVLSGDIAMQANIIFEENGQIEELSTRVNADNLQLHYPKEDLAIRLDHFSGELNYPEGVAEPDLPVWKRMQCALNLDNGSVRFKDQFTLTKLQGNVALDTRDTPSLMVTGELSGHEEPLILKLKGKGAVHDDHAYWLEFDLGLNDLKGTECSAFLSICRPEDASLVFQVEASSLLPQQVEMLKGYFSRSMPRLKEWQVQRGSFGGKLVALFEGGNLSHFEMQDFIGTDVAISSGKDPLYLSKIKGEGRLFSDLNFEMELPAPQFFGFISPELREAYTNYSPEDLAQVHTTIQFMEKGAETSASVVFQNHGESLQFGFKSLQPFPSSIDNITEGWARSEKLSHNFYGPILRQSFEDFEMYGDIDLIASYDGKMIDCALQVDDFLIKHPLMDLKADKVGEKEKTVGRIKFLFDPVASQYEGSVPLHNVQGYDRKYGLYFSEVEGDLQISPKKFSGHIAQATLSFDSIDLAKNVNFYFSYNDTFDFQEVRADLVLPSSHNYNIYLPKFNGSSCDLHFFDDKLKIAHIKGDFVGTWKGSLSLPGLGESIPANFSWDPLLDKTCLELAGENFAVKVEKEKDQYSFSDLKTKNVQGAGAFTLKDKGAAFSSLKLQTPTALLCGSGVAEVQLPSDESDLSIFGELSYQLETDNPIAIKLEAKKPLKWAFSPAMGFVASDIQFGSEGCQVEIDHLEKLSTGKLSARQMQFDVEEEVLRGIFETEALLTLLQDFHICKGLFGKANLEMEKETLTLNGSFKSHRGDLDIDLVWDKDAGRLSLGDAEKLEFSAHLEEGNLQWDSIQGSLGRLCANLKKNNKNQLKGNVQIDFTLFDELFDLPLNHFVQMWDAKAGYKFDGVFIPAKRLYDWGFKGKIKGESFQCGGYELRSMEAKVEVEPGQITIENLDLTDDAGKLWIGEGALMKGNVGQWIFSFPLVEIRGFQPSFLKKMAGSDTPNSPLVLKSATIRDMRGKIDEPHSISGEGNLRFTNTPKKGPRTLPKNLPFQFLQQTGLDGNLFVPTAGEMDFALLNGRIYLRGIHNMISDRNRSEFLPPKSGVMGYLDFDGNLFIDLLVRQRVVRSIPAPLFLRVRGPWADPQISIK